MNTVNITINSRFAELDPEIRLMIIRLANSLAAHSTDIETASKIIKTALDTIREEFMSK